MQIPEYPTAKQYFISPEGLTHLLAAPRDPAFPGKDLLWTTDFKTELPIRLGTTGVSAAKPTTLIEDFRASVEKYKLRSALSVKINGAWVPPP